MGYKPSEIAQLIISFFLWSPTEGSLPCWSHRAIINYETWVMCECSWTDHKSPSVLRCFLEGVFLRGAVDIVSLLIEKRYVHLVTIGRVRAVRKSLSQRQMQWKCSSTSYFSVWSRCWGIISIKYYKVVPVPALMPFQSYWLYTKRILKWKNIACDSLEWNSIPKATLRCGLNNNFARCIQGVTTRYVSWYIETYRL